MAREIRVQIRMSLSNGELSDVYASPPVRIDQDVARLVRNVQPITTAPVMLDTGDVITPGTMVVSNISETTELLTPTVTVGRWDGANYHKLVEVRPGDQFCFRVGIPCSELYAQSNSDDGVLLFYILYND
jgi:hypothetical protein